MQVRIVEFAAVAVAALEHYGAAGQLDQSVRRFIEWRTHSGQSPVASSRTFGIPYNNPDTTAPEAFRFAICGEIDEAVAPNGFGVHARVIPAGRCVVVRQGGAGEAVEGAGEAVGRRCVRAGHHVRVVVVRVRLLSLFTRSAVSSRQEWVPLTPAPSIGTLSRCQSRARRGDAVPVAPSVWLYASTAAW